GGLAEDATGCAGGDGAAVAGLAAAHVPGQAGSHRQVGRRGEGPSRLDDDQGSRKEPEEVIGSSPKWAAARRPSTRMSGRFISTVGWILESDRVLHLVNVALAQRQSLGFM